MNANEKNTKVHVMLTPKEIQAVKDGVEDIQIIRPGDLALLFGRGKHR